MLLDRSVRVWYDASMNIEALWNEADRDARKNYDNQGYPQQKKSVQRINEALKIVEESFGTPDSWRMVLLRVFQGIRYSEHPLEFVVDFVEEKESPDDATMCQFLDAYGRACDRTAIPEWDICSSHCTKKCGECRQQAYLSCTTMGCSTPLCGGGKCAKAHKEACGRA